MNNSDKEACEERCCCILYCDDIEGRCDVCVMTCCPYHCSYALRYSAKVGDYVKVCKD